MKKSQFFDQISDYNIPEVESPDNGGRTQKSMIEQTFDHSKDLLVPKRPVKSTIIKTPKPELRVETRIESQASHRKFIPTQEDVDVMVKPKKRESGISPGRMKRLQQKVVRKLSSNRRATLKQVEEKNMAQV